MRADCRPFEGRRTERSMVEEGCKEVWRRLDGKK